jgi:GNAT superfamily N-acetyltransferase
VDVVDADVTFRSALERAGFIRQDDARPVYHMRRKAGSDAPPVWGYTIRSVNPVECSARVAVHQAAWEPSSLPWHPDHRPPIAPGATSSFTEVAYERVQQTWLYDIAFDLVAVAPDGRFAACCIAWFDPTTGTAEIEPLGVIPGHRRQGLAGALCHEVCVRVAAAGGREVFINTGPNIAYPAPASAYAKAGFETVVRGRTYALRRR